MNELIKKQEILDALSDKQAYLDGWGETNSAVELGKMRVEISNWDAEKAILISEGATNGDMIKAMFPNELLTSITSTLWWGDNMSFNKDWWNAPYKGVQNG